MSIEKRLRVRLLNRNSHKLSLTEPGKLYFERCKGILHDLEKAEDEMESLSSAPCGTLRVACCEACIPSLGLAGVLADSRRRWPEVALEVVMHITQSQRFTTRRGGILRQPFHLERPRHDRTLTPRDQALGGPCRGDRLLAAHEEPPLGAHLVTPRFAYAHHGVYVGGGAVVHYAAFAKHWHRGPVEETSLTCFAHRYPIWVRAGRPNGLQAAEIVERARFRLGENRYRFLSNNCEHFSEWCVNGEHRSPQVERLLARLQCIPRALRELSRYLEVAPLRRSGSPRPTQ